LLGDDRWVDVLWKSIEDPSDRIANVLDCCIDVAVEAEGQNDIGGAIRGDRTQLFDTSHGGHRIFDPLRDF